MVCGDPCAGAAVTPRHTRAPRHTGRRLGRLAVAVVLGPPFLAVFALAMWRFKG